MSLTKTKSVGNDIELAEKGGVTISMAEYPDLTPDTLGDTKEKELENGVAKPTPRPTRIYASIYVGIAVALSTCMYHQRLAGKPIQRH